MNLLLLAGSSLRNKEWIYKVKEELTNQFGTLHVHEYSHWDTEEEFIDLNKELEVLQKEASKLGNYAIFAKSIGTIVSLQGIQTGVLRPSMCVFTGLPTTLIEKEEIDIKTWLQVCKIPILFIQNVKDPLGSFEQLIGLLQDIQIRNCQVVSLPGDTHSYDDLKKLRELVANFVKSK